MGMFSALLEAFRTPDLRNKILFTLGMLVVFRFLAHVPLPGVDQTQLQNVLQGSQLLNLLDLFSGGGLARLSVVALGVNPYINASIIMTLLNQTIPALENLSKEGEYGRNKINQYTRILTVPLALLQGIGVAVFMQRSGVLPDFGPGNLGLTLAILAPIIFAISILLLPSQVAQYFTNSDTDWLKNLSLTIVGAFQNTLFYNSAYFVLVVVFTFFYTAFTFIPNDVADNIKRYGGFIPGIRPGRPTADIYRDHSGQRTELGKKVKAVLDSAAYVPDDITVSMMRERLREIPTDTRIVFDGFPRTVAQADALDRLLGEFGRHVDSVILLDVPREEILARLGKRAKEQGRADDTPEVIGKRFDVYEEQTRPVVDHYA